MKILKAGVDTDRFFERVRAATRRALLLDYDGTLAPFRAERREAFPYPGVPEVLNELFQTGSTRIVLISGRAAQDLVPLLGLECLPEIWASHGWEHVMPDGTCEMPAMEEGARRGLADALDRARDSGLLSYCEQKPAGLALHWRGLPEAVAGEIRAKAAKQWSSLIQGKGLALHEFDGGIELRVEGRHKGDAVAAILSEMGTDVVLAYLGDDLTDEDAFRALTGKGLSVLVRPEFRPTVADVWLQPPAELIEFLTSWTDACRGGR
jgi:trehalose 6-phosphate phosphatase